MVDILDAPVPFLFGIESSILSEACLDMDLLGEEVTQVMLDENSLQTPERVLETVKMPQKELRVLREKLLRATSYIKSRPDPELQQVDFAFPTTFVDPDEEQQGIYEVEVRDAFLEFMSRIMSDYKRFFQDVHLADGSMPERVNSRDCFNFQKFRAQKDGLKPDSFVYLFTDSTIFSNFIESRSLGQTDHDEQIMFFDESLKQQRTKQRQFLIQPFKEKKVVKSMLVNEDGLSPQATF